jgi:molybdenum cofactor biosynthesis enzyme
MSPAIFRPDLKASGLNFRASHTLAATKNTANAPSRKNEVGRPVRSAGILKMSAPVAASVSSSTASTGSSVAVITASAMASKSTSSTNGQTRNESSASLKIGTSTSSSASGGKKWFSCAARRI